MTPFVADPVARLPLALPVAPPGGSTEPLTTAHVAVDPPRRYRTIVADPPWRVEGSQGDGRPWASKGGRRNRETFFPYETQTLDWIQSRPVGDITEKDAHLYLWVTAKFNRLGHGVATTEAWGFECVSEIVWDKINFGLGKFPRPQHEILLVCRRGTLPFETRNNGSVQRWHAPRRKNNGGRIHSAKPDGSYDLIEQASPGPYLELFARTARLGWDSWGDEALNHIDLEALNHVDLGAA